MEDSALNNETYYSAYLEPQKITGKYFLNRKQTL